MLTTSMAGRLSYDAARASGIESYPAGLTPDIPRGRNSPPASHMRASSVQPAAKLTKPFANSQHSRAASTQYLAPTIHHPSQDPSQHVLRQSASVGQALGSPPPQPHSMGPAPSKLSKGQPLPTAASTNSLSQSSTNSSLDSKKSWFGKRKEKTDQHNPATWFVGHQERFPYDSELLLRGNIIQELYDTNAGNCLIYLFPKESAKGPSFKVNDAIFSSSAIFHQQLNGHTSPSQYGNGVAAAPRLSNTSDLMERHLYLDLQLSFSGNMHGVHENARASDDDLQKLVDFRNLFAFLTGQQLVATAKKSTPFSIFLTLSGLLRAYEFSNIDGFTYGDLADNNFHRYVEEFNLLDVRASREKTIEGIILGEKMRSSALYTEAFTHAAGKLNDIHALHSPKYGQISDITKTRLARAAFDLEKKEHAIQIILNDFEFPFIFAGIMSSKTAEERKEGVRFDAWKDAFLNTRRWMLASLKQKYGSWPPKAKSKKNNLEVNGLQRIVLKELYDDMCSLYDLLVDRTQLTTRTVDGIDRAGPVESPQVRAMRSILSEYDRSSPPVKPPIPFDLPILPTLRTTRKTFGTGDSQADAKAATTKIHDNELLQVMPASWNNDVARSPFIQNFQGMELRAAHGCTLQEIIDLRMGQWIFMYAVLQALPLLACDVPGLKFRNGVEYFLCQPPRGILPWIDSQQPNASRTWFSVGDAGQMVSLPSHVIEHSTGGVYRRSHCWTSAQKWTAANPLMNQALQEQTAEKGGTPAMTPDMAKLSLGVPGTGSSRSSSPARKDVRKSSLYLGLEALPAGAKTPSNHTTPISGSRSASSTVDSSKTFDAIMASMQQPAPPTTNTKKKNKH